MGGRRDGVAGLWREAREVIGVVWEPLVPAIASATSYTDAVATFIYQQSYDVPPELDAVKSQPVCRIALPYVSPSIPTHADAE